MAGGRASSSRRCAGCIGGTAPASRRASSRASKVCSSPRARTSGRCRGGNWAEVARRCGCSVRTVQGASERLARLKHRENGRLSAGQFVQRASLIRVPDSQIRSTENVCTPSVGRLHARTTWAAVERRPGAELGAAVRSARGTFGWAGYGRRGRRERPRAGGPLAALSVHARLRRSGFALLCRQPELRADPGALADALKWVAARRRLTYNARIVSAAGAAAGALWRRRGPDGHAHSLSSQVHPRVCGEARSRRFAALGTAGPSPRVRGSRLRGRRGDGGEGSIPACAGKPAGWRVATEVRRVHPRVCGEAAGPRHHHDPARGPSPRVRGSPPGGRGGCAAPGSIPACAGKPWFCRPATSRARVHPRVCGEASVKLLTRSPSRFNYQ